MNHERILFITRTAVLLALTIVFQMLRPYLLFLGPNNIFVIGSLVNASLMVAAAVVGIPGGVIISLIAPVVAFYQGHIAFWFMIPVVALGNAVIVVLFGMLYRKNEFFALAVSAVAKYLVLFLSINVLVQLVTIPAKAAAAMTFSFSWPQLVTALIGGVIALSVLRLLKKALKLDI